VVAMSETRSRRQGSSSSDRAGGHSRRSSSGGDVPDVVEQLSQLKDRAADVAVAVRDGAGSAAGQVKQKAAVMTRAITGTIKEEAERLFDEQKGRAAAKVGRYGKVIHQAAHALHAVKADGLAEFVDEAAEKVEGITDYIEERNLAQVLQDAGEVARRHPGMMLGGMFLTGFALARFLKASAERGDGEGGDEDEESGGRDRSGSGGSGAESRRRG